MLCPGPVPRASARPGAGTPCVGRGYAGGDVQQPVSQGFGFGAVQLGFGGEQILGHSQIQLTLGTYSHVVPELAQEAADRMGAALWN